MADHAAARRDRREHLRLQRPRAGEGRRGRRRQGQPEHPVLGRPGRRSTPPAPPPATPSTPSATPACAAASSELSPKQGVSLGTEGEGWSHPVYTVTPGVPGDSGSAFLDAEGNALGTLSTLAIAPLAGSNGVGDLNSELGYAQQHGGIAGLPAGARHRAVRADPLTTTRTPLTAPSVTGRGGSSLYRYATQDRSEPSAPPCRALLGCRSPRSAPPAAGSRPRPAAGRPPAKATITPGVQMFTKGAQCTANFVFTRRARAASTSGTPPTAPASARPPTPTAAETRSLPLGTRVRFAERRDGRHQRHDARPRHAGLQLVAHHARRGDHGRERLRRQRLRPGPRRTPATSRKVNPSVPFWGGPTGLATGGSAGRPGLLATAQSSLRPTTVLSPKTGVVARRRRTAAGATTSTPSRPASPATRAAASSTPGPGGRTSVDGRDRPAAGLERARQPGPRARLRARHSGIGGLRLVPGNRAVLGAALSAARTRRGGVSARIDPEEYVELVLRCVEQIPPRPGDDVRRDRRGRRAVLGGGGPRQVGSVMAPTAGRCRGGGWSAPTARCRRATRARRGRPTSRRPRRCGRRATSTFGPRCSARSSTVAPDSPRESGTTRARRAGPAPSGRSRPAG